MKIPGRTEPVVAGDYVANAVRPIVELIALDHLHDRSGDQIRYENQLLAASESLGVHLPDPTANAHADSGDFKIVSYLPKTRELPSELTDDSSRVIQIDRTRCILCDRCVRSCRDVKPFKVISHTGRGHTAHITFDLNDPMGNSSCVSCGECAISCPTGALAFRGTVYENRDPWADHDPKPQTVPADDLRREYPLFSQIPLSFLKWNEGAVGRLEVPAGHALCEKGQFGSTAFLIEKGEFDIELGPGQPVLARSVTEGLLGEMACMNNQSRNATVRARTPGRVLVIRRNMLHMLRRNKVARDILEHQYSQRALQNWMLSGTLFEGFSAERTAKHFEVLRSLQTALPRSEGGKQPPHAASPPHVMFLRVDPKEIFIRQGDRADSVYLILSGHVEVAEVTPTGSSHVLAYLKKGQSFGENGVMSAISDRLADSYPERLRGRRTANCKALDHVELIRISKEAIEKLLESDSLLEEELVNRCLDIVDQEPQRLTTPQQPSSRRIQQAGTL